MGSGKTTIGKIVGELLSVEVVDTDQWIEEQEQTTIAEIFKEKGEAYFRQLESQVLHSVTKRNRLVTTGGGIVIKEENRQFMKENGIVIFLDCSVEETLNRLKNDTTRPLLATDKEQQIQTLFTSRYPWYEEAHITVDTTGKAINEVATEVVTRINKILEGETAL